MAQLRLILPKIEQAGATLILVGMGTPDQSAAFTAKYANSLPMIADPDQKLYQAFGLGMASPLELLSPSVGFKAVAAIAQGHMVGLPVGDIRQLPGLFIIDTRGRIVFSHVARDAADHPANETILAALGAAGDAARTAQ